MKRLQFDGIHIFRPSFLIGKRAAGRPVEQLAGLVSPLVAWVLVGRLRKYRPIRAEAVARAMVRAAREATRGVQVHEFDEIRRLAARPTA